MVAAGYIDKNKAEAASVDITSRLPGYLRGKFQTTVIPSYFDAVVNEAIEKYII